MTPSKKEQLRAIEAAIKVLEKFNTTSAKKSIRTLEEVSDLILSGVYEVAAL